MRRQVRQLFLLSAFAGVCMAVGMGLSYRWVAQAQEAPPVTVDAKGLDRLPPIADVAEKLNPTVVAITNTSFVKNRSRGEGDSPFGDDFFNWFFGPQRPGGTFRLAPHPWAEPAERLAVAATASGVEIAVPRPGGRVVPGATTAVEPWWRL